ncbi:unnamed protein product [Mytilus coruscus]|uniref:Mab-21-like nucleotidyltransferase domain-containing protein n=1 Tax=Mytilus coruscus TaxID=42192 RepID=A0A6J8AH50_MYTCO|nr:unnamed protein product [Mytilus coruscus]
MDLMNKQDIYGQTPFYLCLDSQELAITTVRKLLDHGADVNVQDGLGNTILHRIVSLSLGNCEQVVQLLCNAGADPNVMNKNGQSVLSMLQDGQLGVFNILLENEGEVNLKDRWNRDLSKISSKFHDEKFLERIQGICGMNELKDCFGATSLHYAAFTNNVFMINTLLKLGASTNNVDNNGFSPLDVAILFENNDSVSLLHGSYCSLDQEIYSRKRSLFEDIPKVIYSDHIKDLDKIVHVPTALTEFAISLLSTQSDIATEIRNINGQVKCFVEQICSKISEYDLDFALSVLPTGSSAEGTKIGIPDEYDFVVFLDKFSEICEIIQPDILEENSQDYAFACARLTDESKKISMSQYFVEKWTLNSWSVLQKLFFLLRRALFETCRSIDGNLYFKFENDIRHLSSKPVFNVTFVWIGSIYKELEISVDLVPAIRNLGWWPASNKISSMTMTKEARDAGCFLLFQAKQSALERLIICGMDDSVDMLGRRDSAYELNLRTLLRISTAQAEIITMKSFPQIVRDSYMFSKILLKRTPRLLSYARSGPEKTASNLLGISMFERAEYTRFSVDRIISSYMLKNCMFHVLAEFEKGDIDIGVELQKKNIDFIGLTVLVFEHLLKCTEDIFLPSYFLPFIDVFSFEDVEIDEQNPEYLLAMTILRGHRLRMFLSIILHMLGSKAKILN